MRVLLCTFYDAIAHGASVGDLHKLARQHFSQTDYVITGNSSCALGRKNSCCSCGEWGNSAPQVHSARSIALPKHKAILQRHVSRIATAAQKTQEGKETAQQVDAKLEEVFDNIEGAEDDIAAGKLEQKTAMEERQKDPRFAEAKDALDLNDTDMSTAGGHQQGVQRVPVMRDKWPECCLMTTYSSPH